MNPSYDLPIDTAYAARLRNIPAILTPVIVVYEVHKRLKRELSEAMLS
jgi:hypothetical protein